MMARQIESGGSPASDWEAEYRRKSLIAVPLMLFVPVIMGAGCYLWGGDVSWLAVGVGALGWVIALALRAPLIAVTQRLPKDREWPKTLIILASGPCEEAVRLAALLIFGRSFPFALWLGFGWASIEVIYGVIQAVAMARLMGRTDEKALQARAMLAAQGLDKAATQAPVATGAIERISASALHIGFTLLLAAQPLLALVTIPVHSLTNLIATRLMRRSVFWTEVFIALVGATALVAGGFAIGGW
jgi:hypothetical protein